MQKIEPFPAPNIEIEIVAPDGHIGWPKRCEMTISAGSGTMKHKSDAVGLRRRIQLRALESFWMHRRSETLCEPVHRSR